MLISTATVEPISIVLTTLTIIMWILDCLVEIIKWFIDLEKDRVLEAVKKDFEWVDKTKNFVANTVGQAKDTVSKVGQAIGKVFGKKEDKEVSNQ